MHCIKINNCGLMKINLNYYILISILFLLSCQSSNNKEKLVSVKPVKERVDKIDNKTKLFLDYWSGMTRSEYHEITDKLTQKGIVERGGGNVKYILGDKKLKIDLYYPNHDYISDSNPQIDENELAIGVNLWWFDSDSYEIFRKKYNLPKCVIVNTSEFFMEDNPLYLNPNADKYSVGINRKKIGNKEINDFMQSWTLDWKLWGDPSFTEVEWNTRVSVPEDLVIEKDSVVILFTDIKDVSAPTALDQYYKGNRISFLYQNNDEIKSSKRLVKLSNLSQLRATYLPKKWYYQMKKEQEERYKKVEGESQERDKKNNERKSKVSSEI